MPLPSTPEEHVAHIKKKGELLTELAEKWGSRIFTEMFQGDEIIDDVMEMMGQLDVYSLDDPDQDVLVEGTLIDALWYRIMLDIHARIKTTMEQARDLGQA